MFPFFQGLKISSTELEKLPNPEWLVQILAAWPVLNEFQRETVTATANTFLLSIETAAARHDKNR